MSDNGKNGSGELSVLDQVEAKARDGVILRIGELQRQDGLIAEAIDKSNKQQLGVIQTIISANDDDEYRQIFKRAKWKDQLQRDKMVKAYNLCKYTNCKRGMKIILDMITANTAGDDGWLMHLGVDGLNHTTFTTQQIQQNQKRRWFGSGNGNNNSPISQ